MRVKVKVVPQAKKEKIVETGDGLKVYVHAAPSRGCANARLIEMLAGYYGVKKRDISIRHGLGQRSKIVDVEI